MRRLAIALAAFVLAAGTISAAQAERCHARQPCSLRVVSIGVSSVSLAWDAPRNMTAFAAYDVQRLDSGDDAYRSIAQGPNPAYTDSDVTPGATYSYRAAQLDVAGKVLGTSFPLIVTVPMAEPSPSPSPSPTPTGTPPPTSVFPVPTSITADCTVDVTSALNDWVASVPNGTTTVPNVLRFSARACYRVDGTIGAAYGTIHPAGYQRNYLTFDGNGSWIDGSKFQPPQYTNRAGFSFVEGVGITIQDFLITGNHTNPCNLDPNGRCQAGGYDSRYEWQHGVMFAGTDSSTVRQTTIVNVRGDGVTLCCGTNDITLNLLTVDGTGRMGVAIVWGSRISISNSTFDRISYGVIDLENERHAWPALAPIDTVTVSSNTFKRHYLAIIGTGGYCDGTSNITFTDNTQTDPGVTTFPPLYFTGGGETCGPNLRGTNLVITNNTILKDDDNAAPQDNATIFINRYRDVQVEGNRIIQTRSPEIPPVRLWSDEGILSVKRNDMRENQASYSIDGVSHGLGVDACGNTTSAGPNQPMAC